MITLVLVVGACGGRPPAPPSPTSASPVETLSPSLEPSPSPEPSPSRELEQGEMPRTFAPDLGPAELPPEELVPKGADVTGQWFGLVDDGAIVLVAWAEPGSDFSRLARGFALWIRHDSSPHWRAGLVERHDAEDGIQDIQISTSDVTGDDSDDALVFEGIGGSGACGRWLVIDLARRKQTYRRDVCDGRMDPGPPQSPGLVLTESVYRPGDAHCCPSAMRETTLAWNGAAWRVTGKRLIEP